MNICRRIYDLVVHPWQDATQAQNVDSLAHLRNGYAGQLGLFSGAERCIPLLSGASDALIFKVRRLVYGKKRDVLSPGCPEHAGWLSPGCPQVGMS